MNRAKYNKLTSIISSSKSAFLAYSGGVDSSVLAKICHDILKDRFRAVIVKTQTVSKRELNEALGFAGDIGFYVKVIELDIFNNYHFMQNLSDRCYHCKKAVVSAIKEYATEAGVQVIMEASNMDDLGDFRPGIRAVKEFGILQPYILASVNKQEIRSFAKNNDLSVWDKPSAACLVSRIPYKEKIDEKILNMIESAEEFVRKYGVKNMRVRYHDRLARIEVDQNDIPLILQNSFQIARYFRHIGFRYITVDIDGFRTGSMNDLLY